MNRKTVIILVSMLAVMVGMIAVAVAFLYSGESSDAARSSKVAEESRYMLLPAVPSDAVALMCLSDASKAQDLTPFGKFDCRMVVSLHFSGKLVPIYILDAGRASEQMPKSAEEYIARAKEAGADSFWYKDISPEALIDVIDRTMAGEHLFPGEKPRVKLGLTEKEIEVLRYVCEGLEYSEMAEALGVSERTVKYHVSNLLSKTGYANRTRLAIAVTNKKFIVPNLADGNEFDTTE